MYTRYIQQLVMAWQLRLEQWMPSRAIWFLVHVCNRKTKLRREWKVFPNVSFKPYIRCWDFAKMLPIAMRFFLHFPLVDIGRSSREIPEKSLLYTCRSYSKILFFCLFTSSKLNLMNEVLEFGMDVICDSLREVTLSPSYDRLYFSRISQRTGSRVWLVWGQNPFWQDFSRYTNRYPKGESRYFFCTGICKRIVKVSTSNFEVRLKMVLFKVLRFPAFK